MDEIINYLLLTIIFVFDPLAIALVVAANYAFEQRNKKYKSNLYGEKVKVKEDYWEDDKDDLPEPNEALKDAVVDYKEDLDISELEEKISKTSKPNKYGPTGWKTLTNKLMGLKKSKEDNDDLTIKY